ncbi:MAG: rod-binding protein [Pirellulaceae bacterium]
MQGIDPLLPTGSLVQSAYSPNSLSEVASSPDSESVASVSSEFESVFLAMLLKTMRSTVSGDGMFAGDKSDTFGGMFDLFMSQHLADSDALGIGQLLKQSLTTNNQADHPAQ